MTKKELVKIIREVVRREIKKEINEIFIKEQTTSTQLADVIPQVSEPKKKISYTNNKSLNDEINTETIELYINVKNVLFNKNSTEDVKKICSRS